jgi:hypothetical protein
MPRIVLTLLKRADCHLCDEMAAVVGEVVRSAGDVRLEAQDVDSAPGPRALYGNEVPVLLVNGRKAFKYRVAPGQLRRRLWAERRRAGLSRWWRSGL